MHATFVSGLLHHLAQSEDAILAARPPVVIDYDCFVFVHAFAALVGTIRDTDTVVATFPSRHLWS